MAEGSLDLRQSLIGDLRRHPRVAHQGLFAEVADREVLAAALPAFVPFRGSFARALWIVDWDHRLPSRAAIVRLLAYYTEFAYDEGVKAYEARAAEIAKSDLFVEFDVPDFAGLRADEAYEAEMDVGKTPERFRLVSEWRRQVDAEVGRKAEAIVRVSDAFKTLSASLAARSPALGDLEAAEWTPPSESRHPRWAVEVWYLKTYNGMVGEGTAFVVDPEEGRVVSQRDFQFRAG